MLIYSWNVNGIRSVQNKGLIGLVDKDQPDILCLQEIKAQPEQLPKELVDMKGYNSCWNSGERRGYSGVATYSKQKPLRTIIPCETELLHREGRVLLSEYESFALLNVYFPNGQKGEERLQYKLRFYDEIIDYCEKLKQTQSKLIICGDFNTAHCDIDLKNPRANENRSGFLPVEREMLDRFLAYGYVDVYRYLYPEQVQYSWWSYRTAARSRNAGWRIDYFYVSADMLADVEDCVILDKVEGSDHCPIALYIR